MDKSTETNNMIDEGLEYLINEIKNNKNIPQQERADMASWLKGLTARDDDWKYDFLKEVQRGLSNALERNTCKPHDPEKAGKAMKKLIEFCNQNEQQ